MIILIDQDGPLADFEKGFFEQWTGKFPDEFCQLPEQRKTFYVRDDYPRDLREKVESIYCAPGFYRNLPAVRGSIDALKALTDMGHDVWICSSPLSQYQNCVLEKYEWVEKHLGLEFTKRVILCKDKRFIRGNILIDDKPFLEGADMAEWEHVIFDYPYNRHVENKRRLTWMNWREVLKL